MQQIITEQSHMDKCNNMWDQCFFSIVEHMDFASIEMNKDFSSLIFFAKAWWTRH